MLLSLFGTWVLVTGLLAFLAVGRRIGWIRRAVLVALLPVVLGAGGATMLHLMPGPKPHAWEHRAGKTEVIAARWQEGVAIWIWVVWPGDETPKAYTLPWSEESARHLEAGAEEGERMIAEFPDEGVFSDLWFQSSLEDRNPPMLYGEAQPADPPKQAPPEPPRMQFPER